jgi:hypothetical protein
MKQIHVIGIITTMIVLNLILNLTAVFPSPESPLQMSVDLSQKNLSANENSISSPGFHHVIFYNVFINPKTSATYRESRRIIDEQLGYMSANSRVYYYLIGKKFRKNICRNFPTLHCSRIGYQKTGGEVLTLQALWDYCRANKAHRVTYLHDKGSYRFSIGNTRNRQRATRGALSPECMSIPSRWNCNICGTKLQVMPYMIYQANMWTAECSYIRQLVPPDLYNSQREAMLQKWYSEFNCLARIPNDEGGARNLTWHWNLTDPLFLQTVGLGRFALERWVLNHPNFRPCEVWPLGIIGMNNKSKLSLGLPSEWGKSSVPSQVKSRLNWMLLQEYSLLYSNATINDFLATDFQSQQAKPC